MAKNPISKIKNKKKGKIGKSLSFEPDSQPDSDIDLQDVPTSSKVSICSLNSDIIQVQDSVKEIAINMRERGNNLESMRERSDTITSDSSELFQKIRELRNKQNESNKHWSFCHCNKKMTFAVISIFIFVGVITFIGIAAS